MKKDEHICKKCLLLCWDSGDENWVDPSFFKQVEAIKKNCKAMYVK